VPTFADVGDGGAKDVLNGMFDLFQNVNDPVPVRPAAKRASAPSPAPTLVLPKANTTAKKQSNFFERLFGRSKKPQQKKPTPIFGF